MKKILICLLLASVLSAGAFAQEGTRSITDPDPTIVGNDSAKQSLRETSVDLFEREGSWNARISPDDGVISARLFDGGPEATKSRGDEKAKDPVPFENGQEVENSKVLGVKVEFFHRGLNSFFITAARPLPIEGVTKTVSIWAVGRNQAHKLTLLVQDYFGNNFELFMGTLAFSGWKKMSVAVPPSPDGVHGIIQSSAYHGDRPGLRIVGFRVDCEPELAKGTYFLYLDDLRAYTDLYDMEHKDSDDMNDNW